ncbi:hypothetical protein BB561_004986 [Smittium simulii]|uniref:Mitochondrial thiamine pyrophosphate carrier 1 n=1 Tax=Smittium simulii TaxID=133385 RepID=A0A2T9YCZ2_9FUNG|nr:hypothetical protein BB561_004986 [Smittium simulii]
MSSASMQTIPYIGIIFGTYDIISSLIIKIHSAYNLPHTNTTNLINNTVAGAASGIIAKFIVYPLDLVRKRMQVQGPNLKKFVGTNELIYPKGFFATFKYVANKEGITGLFRGLLPSLLKAGPSSASVFFAFGVAQNLMLKYTN